MLGEATGTERNLTVGTTGTSQGQDSVHTHTPIKARATHKAGEHSTTEPHPPTKDWGPGTQNTKEAELEPARTVLWDKSDQEQSKRQGGPSGQIGL